MPEFLTRPWNDVYLEGMETTRRIPQYGRVERADYLDKLAWWMDQAFQIPGTKIRVGLDAILGLIPGGGDFVSALIQSGLVIAAVTQYQVPKALVARMLFNVLLDSSIGAIPFVGDIFDAFYKANTKNMRLLQQARESQRMGQAPSSTPHVLFLGGVILVLVAFLVILGFGIVTLTRFIFQSV